MKKKLPSRPIPSFPLPPEMTTVYENFNRFLANLHANQQIAQQTAPTVVKAEPVSQPPAPQPMPQTIGMPQPQPTYPPLQVYVPPTLPCPGAGFEGESNFQCQQCGCTQYNEKAVQKPGPNLGCRYIVCRRCTKFGEWLDEPRDVSGFKGGNNTYKKGGGKWSGNSNPSYTSNKGAWQHQNGFSTGFIATNGHGSATVTEKDVKEDNNTYFMGELITRTGAIKEKLADLETALNNQTQLLALLTYSMKKLMDDTNNNHNNNNNLQRTDTEVIAHPEEDDAPIKRTKRGNEEAGN